MEATLEAVTRSTFGKNESRRLRRDGRIPAVVYGGVDPQAGSVSISVDPKLLLRIMYSESGANTLIGLTIDGGAASQVLVKQYQLDPKWAAVLASALFSTINRGLDEVEDRHERMFLEGLLSTLE